MTHLLVSQLRFARSEFRRALEGVTAEEAVRRFMPMNSISWMVGHLANQENRYWVNLGQGKTLAPGLNDLVGYHKPASTPALDEMWVVWGEITTAADAFLDTLTPEKLSTFFIWKDKPVQESIGTLLQRNIYHYWYHTGESAAVRQMLGHTDLPEFVGDMSAAIYQPEP
jgi:uncharacterized damage-inducible protein DinB